MVLWGKNNKRRTRHVLKAQKTQRQRSAAINLRHCVIIYYQCSTLLATSCPLGRLPSSFEMLRMWLWALHGPSIPFGFPCIGLPLRAAHHGRFSARPNETQAAQEHIHLAGHRRYCLRDPASMMHCNGWYLPWCLCYRGIIQSLSDDHLRVFEELTKLKGSNRADGRDGAGNRRQQDRA